MRYVFLEYNITLSWRNAMDMSMSGSRFLAWIVDTKQTLLNHGWWISQLTRKSRCEQYQGRDPSLPDTTAQFTDSGFLALFSRLLHLPLVLSGGRMTSSWVQITEQQASSLMKRRVQGIIYCIPHRYHAFYVWWTRAKPIYTESKSSICRL